jgi:hypothetical protein
MVETLLTPAPPHCREALLDEPLAGTLDHARAQRQTQRRVCLIVDMIAVPFQIRIHGGQGISCRCR